MAKQLWKPGNMLYPLPVVLVTVSDGQGHDNVMTVAWTGTVCSDPPMLSISVTPERYSHQMIEKTGEFAVNLTTEDLTYATDFCGVRSGREMDKFSAANLTRQKADQICAPLIAESPVNIECRVERTISLGSHDMYVARVLCVHVDENCLDKSGRLDLTKTRPLVYDHGRYYSLGRELASFGYSVKKKGTDRHSSHEYHARHDESSKNGAAKNQLRQPAKESQQSSKSAGKRAQYSKPAEGNHQGSNSVGKRAQYSKPAKGNQRRSNPAGERAQYSKPAEGNQQGSKSAGKREQYSKPAKGNQQVINSAGERAQYSKPAEGKHKSSK